MPQIGSYKDWEALDKVRISAMMRDTAHESLEKLHEMVKDRTPVDAIQHRKATHLPGHLKRSIQKSGGKRISRNVWYGEVFSNASYVESVEYGVGPKILVPKRKKWLRWTDDVGKEHFAKEVKWPGFGGAHMFQKAKTEFEKFEAEAIARKNATQWLGASSTQVVIF